MKQERYDVVVVGAGIGGMCAGALLAHAGYKTLVVEKLPQIGGRCSTLEYKGFTLSTGAMTVPAYGGPIEQTFKELGAEYEVRPIPQDNLIHYRIRGEDCLVSAKEGLAGLISFASKGEGEAKALMSAIQRGITWQEPSAMIPLRDWLLQYTQNEVILGVFHTLVANHHSVNLDELPAAEFFHYLKDPMILRTSGFAPRGNLALWESLAKAMQKNNGQVWTRCPAKRIVVADGVVKGVVIDKGGEEVKIAAKVVISNAGPKKTAELVGSENLDKGYLREVRERLRPAPGIIFCIAVPRDRPLTERVRLYVTGARRLTAIRCPTLICPELSPSGKHLLYANGIPGSSMPPIDFKKEIELCIQDLKENLPGFDRYAEILTVNCFHGDWPIWHSWCGYDLSQKTPVENLYNVGDGVRPAGWTGVDAPAKSSQIVVDDIKRRIKPGRT